jgi:hypothetical protein
MSRKPHEPTEKDRKQVSVMAGIGLTHDQIADVMGISDETLRKYYSKELKISASVMTAQVANNLYSIATSKGQGSVSAAIFWMKTRGGWREKDRIEVTGKDGEPIQIQSVPINTDEMDEDELAVLDSILSRLTDKT